MHRSIRAALAAALATSLLVSACGEERVVASNTTAGEALPADAIELNLAMAPAGPEAVDEATEVVRARLQSLGIEASSVEPTADGIAVRIVPEDEDLVRQTLQMVGNLEFRPVLARVGTADGVDGHPLITYEPEEELVADSEVTLPAADGAVYRLGPVALDGRALERASAAETNGMWTVSPVFRAGEDGIDRFNAIVAVCFDGEPACPPSTADDTGATRGQLAIVLDGVILSAPTINSPQFERDQISISGSFDENSARALAAALDAGGAPATWALPD